MNRQQRQLVLINQMDLLRELLDEQPELKETALHQFNGMIRYSRAIGDLDYSYETRLRNFASEYFNQPKGYRRMVQEK